MRAIRSILVLLALFFAGCQDKTQEPLKVGANDWLGYDMLFLAKDKKFLNNVATIHSFPNNSEILRLFRNNLLDAAALTLDEALTLYSEGYEIGIIMIFDSSNGADALITKKEIASLQDLQGKKIGYESSALGAFMLHKILEKAKLNFSQIKPVNISLDKHVEAFNNNEVDAVITFDPPRSTILKNGGMQLFDSSMIPGQILDVLIVKKELILKNDPRLHKLLDGYFQALAIMQKEKVHSSATPFESKEYFAILQEIQMFSREQNRNLYENKTIDDTIESLYATMKKANIITDGVSIVPEKILFDQFLKEK